MSSPLRFFVLLWSMMLLAVSSLHAEEGFKYSYLPKQVYENQLFPVTIIDTRQTKTPIRYSFGNESSVRPLSLKPLVIKNGNERFYTFYYKAKKNEITIPSITIKTEQAATTLPPHTIPVYPLQSRKDFCGVLAADMKIRNAQVSHYDEKNYLVTLSIEAYEANLEDMHLDHAIESGVEDLSRHGAKAEAEFYVVVPSTQNTLSFSYFNTIKQQYVVLHTPIELMDSTVVTQSDLNPKDDSFEKFKKYAVGALAGFFFLMFLLYRDFFYLVLGTVSLITLLTFYTPKTKICIRQGAKLYILPTETSGISTKTEKRYETPLLGRRLDYNKVQYKHGIIGWVKDEDLCKN